MDVMDISNLFGNALDNAIESTDKITDPERRLIHLSVARQKALRPSALKTAMTASCSLKTACP